MLLGRAGGRLKQSQRRCSVVRVNFSDQVTSSCTWAHRHVDETLGACLSCCQSSQGHESHEDPPGTQVHESDAEATEQLEMSAFPALVVLPTDGGVVKYDGAGGDWSPGAPAGAASHASLGSSWSCGTAGSAWLHLCGSCTPRRGHLRLVSKQGSSRALPGSALTGWQGTWGGGGPGVTGTWGAVCASGLPWPARKAWESHAHLHPVVS